MNRRAVILRTGISALIFGFVLCAAYPSAPQPRRVDIDARRFDFAPSVVTLKTGQPVVLALKCEDAAHGLRFRELGIEAKCSKGGTAELRFTPERTGDFVGHCSVFCGAGHGHMILTLRVVD